jgi:hypothetical protein
MKSFLSQQLGRVALITFAINFAFLLKASDTTENTTTYGGKILQQTAQNQTETLLPTALIHFWLFDTSLPNDTPLEIIEASYGLVEGGVLSFISALAGYPFDPEHPNWRKASMERRNAPTDINYRPEGNNGISFENSNMRGIQIKQPFTGDGGANTMIFHLPTTDYKDIIFKFAAKDEDAADNLVIDYSVAQGSPQWITTGLSNPNPELTSNYQLFELNFSNISACNDNPDFIVRIRFDGSNMSADEGNRVTFNNFSLDGNPVGGGNLPPVVEQPISLQKNIESGDVLVFDLNDVFSDPDNDPLTFTAQSNRPAMALVSLNDNFLTVTPIKRGDAVIEITADDGNYPPVTTTFRVLVFPQAYPLNSGTFTFGSWDSGALEYTYPQHILFMQSDMSDPGLNDPLLFPYYIPHDDYHDDDLATIGYPYNNTRRTRINGLGEEGISFINTGRGRDLGGLVLALDTRGVTEATLDWLGGTILQNERIYAIRLQYRTGLNDLFADLTHNSQIIEYVTSIDGHIHVFENIHLPAGALNQEYLQLRWKYYHVTGDSGPRAELRLDDIIFKDLTSIDESKKVFSLVYFDGTAVNIQFAEPVNGLVSVFDITGRLLAQQNINNSNLSTLPLNVSPGVYIINATSENGSRSEKLLIE